MENPFYSALEAVSNISASQLSTAAQQTLLPFKFYLDNSITALEEKQVSCSWQPLACESYQLSPQSRIYEITPISVIELQDNNEGWYEIIGETDGTELDEFFTPDISEKITVGKGSNRKTISLEPDHYLERDSKYKVYLPDIDDLQSISWCGYQLKLSLLSFDLNTITFATIDGRSYSAINNKKQLKIEAVINSSSQLIINGISCLFTIVDRFDFDSLGHFDVIDTDRGWLIFTPNKPQLSNAHIKDITQDRLSKLSISHFSAKGIPLANDKWALAYTKKSGFILTASQVKNEISDVVCTEYPQILFNIKEEKIKDKWIQLIELDNVDDTGRSSLDYFFDDYIKILDKGQRDYDSGYKVIKAKPEERQLLLAYDKKGEKHKSVYPDLTGKKELRVKVDTSQLRKQKYAVFGLMQRPSIGQMALTKLLQNRDTIRWPQVKSYADHIKWEVLTNTDFDGCKEQREFVEKALSSQDFTILDGPPGTGKTTTILELIVQLVRQGKRILLSASTHAAINNVLERIEENNLQDEVFPLRIGKVDNAINVEQFHFDNLLESCNNSIEGKLSKQLLVDSSNLICGTTIGILKLFNEKEVSLDRGEPPFDVMIIDECSKTTFQEFLVPARYAKRFVLVGDVRQLSPFTDREQIVANLQQLMLKPPSKGREPITLDDSIQKACFLLEECRGNGTYKNLLVVPVSDAVLFALSAEIKARSDDALKNILLISLKRTNREGIYSIEDTIKNPMALYQHNVCFIANNALDKLHRYLPADVIVLSEQWQSTQQAFVHNAQYKDKQELQSKGQRRTSSIDIHKHYISRLNETDWAEELCWRLEREYWLRLSTGRNNKTAALEKQINRILPAAIDVKGRVHNIKNIAFPSILEALSSDGLVKQRNHSPTTLNQGFNRDEKSSRHTTLTYQHRMHPDISAFPRKQFYQGESLHNGKQVEEAREWDYPRFTKHSVWLNVQGQVFKNANKKEVDAIIKEVKSFCEWAESKVKNDNNEPFDVAILTFYKGQEKALREALQQLTNTKSYARFSYLGIAIKLATVDYFQGQEADFVLLSMVNTTRDGFLDSPNRLNVAITRARYQLLIVGHHNYYSGSRSQELQQLAKSCQPCGKEFHV